MIATGCTVRNTFTIPYKRDEIAALYVTYCQKEKCVVEKTLDDCTFREGSFFVDLSQEDTLKLCPCARVQVQYKGRLTDGVVFKSKIKHTTTDGLLNRDVI